MIFYFSTLFLVVFWVWLEKVSLNRRAIWFPASILILFASIRSFTVGTDTALYTERFRYNFDPLYYEVNSEVELGYQLFERIILTLFDNYFWLFFFTSTIVVFSFLLFFKKYSKDYLLSVFIFICFGYYTLFFNGLRNAISIAILVCSIPYLLSKKFLKFLLIVFFASLFHISAWILLPFYFLIHLNLKLEIKILGVFLFSFLVSSIGIQFLASSNKRYEHYTQASENAGGYLTLLLYVVFCIFFYFFGKKARENSESYRLYEQLFICGVALVVPIAFLGTDPSGPQRILYIFAWLLTLMFPYVFQYLKNTYMKIIFIILSLIYFYLITTRFSNLVPYNVNSIFEIF
ncbi:EpsG family protein [Acinetobacter pullicarnis]|uniref:EpsG family protein n=1 Tax=Acinetobacter pullicarnis TaxID=2576829 RepID=UPI00111CF9B2|nr:EpsG family protein [Acinetobacter pullicarnis]